MRICNTALIIAHSRATIPRLCYCVPLPAVGDWPAAAAVLQAERGQAGSIQVILQIF